MIDLHCHLLPGIDDGPKTMAMATTSIPSNPSIKPLRNSWEYEGIPLQVGMAAEVRIGAELPGWITHQKLPYLATWENRRVILFEFSHDYIPVGFDDIKDFSTTIIEVMR